MANIEAHVIASAKGNEAAEREATRVEEDATTFQILETSSGKNATSMALRTRSASPSFSRPHETTSPKSTPVQAPLHLTYNDSKDEADVQEPSKAIVKVSTDDDDKKKLAIVETHRALPSVGTFTVQCALCLKWRLIPTKEQYEEIRQFVLEKPFFCSSTISWRPDASCENTSDVSQDETHLWAIDRPNIPVPPRGWDRQLVIRGVGASKFADVYYVAPSGRKFRSMPEVERFLAEFPEVVKAGVKQSQFSFIIPRPLDSNYCRKKVAGSSPSSESQKLSSVSKSKKSQSIKRKAFESFSIKEGTQEQMSREKKSFVTTQKLEKGSGEAASYDSLISQQVVKGLLPPDDLSKEPNSVNPDHGNVLVVSQEPPTDLCMENAELQNVHTHAKHHGESPAGEGQGVPSGKKQNTFTEPVRGHSTPSANTASFQERAMGVGS